MYNVTHKYVEMDEKGRVEFEIIVAELIKSGFKPIIREMIIHVSNTNEIALDLENVIEIFGNAISPYQFMGRRYDPGKLGDIILHQNFVVTLILERNIFKVTVISPMNVDALINFYEIIGGIFKDKLGREIIWKDGERESDIDAEEDLIGHKAIYEEEMLNISKLLVDEKIRKFSIKLAQMGKIRDVDASDTIEPHVVQGLIDLKMITQEYLLLCRQDQHIICVLSSEKDLKDQKTNSLRCGLCNRLFDDEHISTIYTLTPQGKKMLDKSLWMQIWITELLRNSGMQNANIKWGLEKNGEELDIMIQILGKRVFLELKDREFGLGDAYPFVYRVNRYKGIVGIVATMGNVSPDAKKFINEQKQIVMATLEGKEQIENNIKLLIETVFMLEVKSIVEEAYVNLGINIWPIIEKWMKGNARVLNANEQGN